jgi:tetratricopeptide (TPR) repeat protein
VESPLSERLFRRRQIADVNSRPLCPVCYQRYCEKGWAIKLIPALGLSILAVVQLVAQAKGRTLVALVPWSLLLNLGVFYVLVCASVAPHELAHAVIGWLMGFQIARIRIGIGPRLAEFNLGGTRVTIRTIPISGSVWSTTDFMRAWRWRRLLYIAAGPAANVLIFWWAKKAVGPFPSAPGWDIGDRVTPLAALAAANLYLFANSLFRRRPTLIGSTVSLPDGLAIRRLLFQPLPSLEQRQLESLHTKLYWLLVERRSDETIAAAECAVERFTTDPFLRVLLAGAHLQARHYHESRASCLRLILELADKTDLRALVCSDIAWADLMIGTAELLSEAGEMSAQAMGMYPWVYAVQNTRALFLLESGEVEPAMALLIRALAAPEVPAYDKSLILSSMAMCHARLGELGKARQALSRARKIDPNGELINRAEAVIASAGNHRGSTDGDALREAHPAIAQPTDVAAKAERGR